jgi:hypothetical protein
MPYRYAVLAGMLIIGCGKVGTEASIDASVDAHTSAAADASPDAAGAIDATPGIDATTCTVHDTIQSCGPSCDVCTATGEREVATCNGVACGTACVGDAPRCSDNTCSRLLFDFDSNTLEGATPRAPQGLQLAVRNQAGNLALAIDVTNLTEVSFQVPVCISGTVNLTPRTLTARVFFEGGNSTGAQYYVQASVPDPVTGAFLGSQSFASGSYMTFSAPLSMSQFSNTTTSVTFQAGTFGAQFSGTIWFDDIKIQ